MSARAAPAFRYSWSGPPAHCKGWVTTLVANGCISDGGVRHSKALVKGFKKLRMEVEFGDEDDEQSDGFPMTATGTRTGLPMSVFVRMFGQGMRV